MFRRWLPFLLGAAVGVLCWLSGWGPWLVYEIRTLTQPPPITPDRGLVSLGRVVPAPDAGDPVLGEGNPTLAVFVDYRCEASRQFLFDVLPRLDAAIAVYDYPLTPEDERVAATANCIFARFGKDAFWNYLRSEAVPHGCTDLAPWLDEVRADKRAAARLGVVGTPTAISLANGQAVAGLQDWQTYRRMLEAER